MAVVASRRAFSREYEVVLCAFDMLSPLEQIREISKNAARRKSPMLLELFENVVEIVL